MLELIVKIISNKYRDSFTAQLGTALLLSTFGIATGSFGGIVLGFLLRGVVGIFLEKGILVIDLSLISIDEGRKLKEFKAEAEAAYARATAKVYDEKQKEKIRKEYLEIIAKFGTVGNPKP